MSLGPEAYVLEPEELRKMIRVDLRKTIFQYEGARAARNGEEGMLRKSDAGG